MVMKYGRVQIVKNISVVPNTDHEVLIRKLSVKLHDKEIRELCELCAEHEEQEFLYGLMFSGEKRVGDNAAWVLNHLTKEDGRA